MGEELILSGMPFYFNASDYTGAGDNRQIGRVAHIYAPYLDYTAGGSPAVTRNVEFPEIVITPDSKKNPGVRAVLERERRRVNDLSYGRGTYNALRDAEQVDVNVNRRKREWENSTQAKALQFGRDVAMGVGLGADIVSGLPIYSGLHGAAEMSRAQDWSDRAWAALWLTPFMKPTYNGVKTGVMDAAKAGYNLLDDTFFLKHPDSFTRGIGGQAGLDDLIKSGVIRGNPLGSETSAQRFGKLWRKNRHGARSIFESTGIKGIQNKWFNRSLSEEEFNALKKAEQEYYAAHNTPTIESPKNTIQLYPRGAELLTEYDDYADYLAQLKKYGRPTSLDDSGEALAYFYDNGRNPLSKGHDYASSQYGVRINNASSYHPRIFPGHLHYSMPKAVRLDDPNVEVFRTGPLGITVKMDKKRLLRQNTNKKK